MRVRIHNRTGLTIVTAAHPSQGSVSIGETVVEMEADAWAHTLVCGPSIGRMVERGEIEVRTIDEAPALTAVEPVSEVPPVDDAGATVPENVPDEPAPASPVEPPRQSGGGKRRR